MSIGANGWTRRRLLQGGLGALIAACPGCGMQEEWLLCSARNNAALPTRRSWHHSSGDAGLDRTLINELHMQKRFFGYRPAFILFSGGEQNAIASSRTQLTDTQGTIYFNLDFLRRHLLGDHWGGSVIAGIIAHENAHIYQYNQRIYWSLRRLHATPKVIELHGDFLSGVYMGLKANQLAFDPGAYFETFYHFGDQRRSAPDHHGTQEERFTAVVSGYNLARRNPSLSVDKAHLHAEQFIRGRSVFS